MYYTLRHSQPRSSLYSLSLYRTGESSPHLTIRVVWYRKDIVQLYRRYLRDERDVYRRLLTVYKEFTAWWYAALGH